MLSISLDTGEEIEAILEIMLKRGYLGILKAAAEERYPTFYPHSPADMEELEAALNAVNAAFFRDETE